LDCGTQEDRRWKADNNKTTMQKFRTKSLKSSLFKTKLLNNGKVSGLIEKNQDHVIITFKVLPNHV
jgi:hypothetical protein